MTFQTSLEPESLNPPHFPESMTSADLDRALFQMLKEDMPKSEMKFFNWMFELSGRHRLYRNPNHTIRTFQRKFAAECFKVHKVTIWRWIKKLHNEGWITVKVKGRAYLIYLHKSPRRYRQK